MNSELWKLAGPINPRFLRHDRRDSPLHVAAFNPNCDADLVKKMLDLGADVNAINALGQTPLHYMIQFKRCPYIVKMCLENRAYVNALDRNSESLLHYALNDSQYNLDIIRHLLEGGAFVNQPNRQRATPLHFAARLCNLHVIELLLQHEARASAIDKYGQSTLHWALNAVVIDQRVIELLINNGGYVLQPNRKGVQPLHVAAYKGNFGIVQLLLDNGAMVNALDNELQSPLNHALNAIECNAEVVKLLLERGADVHKVNYNGEQIIHLACYKCKPDIIQLLLDYGASVNAGDLLNSSPLHSALRHNNLKAVKLLIKTGSSLTHRNYFSQQPLHMAAIHSGPGAVKLLLDHGASPNVLDGMNYSPLLSSCLSTNKGYIKTIMQLLFNAGAQVFLGTSPVLMACSILNNNQIANREEDCVAIYEGIKLLIKYSLLEQPRVFHRVLFVSPTTQQSLYSFMQSCLVEISSECPDRNLGLREFIVGQRQNEDRDIDEILRVLTRRPYPLYKEVIANLLTIRQLRQKLELQFQMMGMTFSKCKVPLMHMALNILVGYISDHEDLLNLSLAFYDISHLSK